LSSLGKELVAIANQNGSIGEPPHAIRVHYNALVRGGTSQPRPGSFEARKRFIACAVFGFG
jgi:hypothetical protein